MRQERFGEIMRIRRRKHISSDFAGSGILSDLAFLLLIFFLAVGTFVPDTGFDMEISGSGEKSDEHIEMVLSKEGYIYKGKKISAFSAGFIVRKAVLKNSDTAVRLISEPDVKYQQVVNSVEMMKKAGAENFSLEMERQ